MVPTSAQAAIRVGVRVTVWCLIAFGLLVISPWWVAPNRRVPFLALIAIAGLVLVPMAREGWRARLSTRFGDHLLHAWAIADIVVVGAAVAISGDHAVGYFFVLPIIYFSSLCSRPWQAALLGSVAAVETVLVVTSLVTPSAYDVAAWTIVLGAAAALTSFLSEELRARTVARIAAEELAVRRAELSRALANAARGVFTLDLDEVLQRVVETAHQLDFEYTAILRRDAAAGGYRVSHHTGLPSWYVDGLHPLSVGIVGDVFNDARTVVVNGYQHDPRRLDRAVEEHGITALAAIPIRVGDDVPGVLMVSTATADRAISTEETEALELLAVQAGAALVNARQFRDQARLNDRLRDLDRLKDDFMATASHELRTPATVVKAAIELLDLYGDRMDDGRRHDLLGRALAHTDELVEVIERLTRFRDLDLDDVEADIRPVRLGPRIVRAVDRTHVRCGRHRISWGVDGDPIVLADTSMLDVLLDALLENACVHTTDGTAVHLRVHLEDDHAVIAVVDAGPGLPEEVVVALGQPFARGGDLDTRPTRGLGLGLASALRIVRLLETRLEVSSPVSGGARVAFRLALVSLPPEPSDGDQLLRLESRRDPAFR